LAGDDADFHLAQINIGRLQAPLDSPEIAEFVAALAPINALADRAPGFVWRLQTEDGNATSIRPFPDDSILVNMSVWTSLESLADYVYRSAHTAFLRRRHEWFQHMAESYLALWWVPAGHIPSTTEAAQRLNHLRDHGPTPYAFTFRSPFPPPGSTARIEAREDDLCPSS
jgi:hypothetical protein